MITELVRLSKIEQVYTAIAQLLPAEGRDYITSVNVAEDTGVVNVTMRGVTPIGSTFAEYCMSDELTKAINPGDNKDDRRTKDDGGGDTTPGSDTPVYTEEHVL